jgi:serine/threonine protein kinase
MAMEPLATSDPTEVAGYRLLGRLGAGGMGVVYLAFTPGGRPVALKVVRPELGDDASFRVRFRQEISAAQRVHGLYTAQLLDADSESTPAWLVTAYVAGPSLAEAVAAHGPMPEQSVLVLVAGVAEALAVIHAAGVVHRDLKPSNVLLAADGPRVIDFGIARAIEATALTRTGMRIGSPMYMSPEQVRGGTVTPAADIFALGALACYAAQARPPFGEGNDAALLYRVLHEDADLAGCPQALRSLIQQCLVKDPAARPAPATVIAACRDRAAAPTAEFAVSWLPPAVAADLSRHAAPPPSILRNWPPNARAGPRTAAAGLPETETAPGPPGPLPHGPQPQHVGPPPPAPAQYARQTSAQPPYPAQPPGPPPYAGQTSAQPPYRAQPPGPPPYAGQTSAQPPYRAQPPGPPPYAGQPPAPPPYAGPVPGGGYRSDQTAAHGVATPPQTRHLGGPSRTARPWRPVVISAAAAVLLAAVGLAAYSIFHSASPRTDADANHDQCLIGTWTAEYTKTPTTIGGNPVTFIGDGGATQTFRANGTDSASYGSGSSEYLTYGGYTYVATFTGGATGTWTTHGKTDSGELITRYSSVHGTATLTRNGSLIAHEPLTPASRENSYMCSSAYLVVTSRLGYSETLMRAGS